jgi:CRP-like cAMP-binding protein
MQPRRLSTPQQPHSFGNIKTSNIFRWKSSQTRRKKTNIAHGDQMSSENIYSRIQKAVTQFLGKTRTLPIPRWISPQYHTTSISEIFGHASFLLVAISYAVDDFVQLRLIAIGGSSAMLVFTYFHPHGRVLWLPFKWNLLFTLINSYRVLKIYADRFFANQLDDLMLYMYDHHFYVMDKVDFAELIGLGTTETFKKGEVLVGQGDDNRYIRVVLKGELNVERDGLTTYKLRQGNFISESGLHAGLLLRGVVCSCCSVIANDDNVVVFRWDRTELMYLLESNKNTRRALKAVMSWDIVSKLKSQRSLVTSGIIEDPEEWTRKRREQTLHRYRGILRNMLTHPAYLNKRKEELSKYRDIHHIDSVEHEQALRAMGWTQAEYDAGKKEGQIDEDLAEKKHYDWTSYAKDAYLRLFE